MSQGNRVAKKWRVWRCQLSNCISFICSQSDMVHNANNSGSGVYPIQERGGVAFFQPNGSAGWRWCVWWFLNGLLRWDLQWQRRHNVRPDGDGCAVKMATVISLNRSFNSIITVDEEWISCLIKCCNSATAHIHVWTTVLLQIQITLDWKFIGLISMKDWRFPL